MSFLFLLLSALIPSPALAEPQPVELPPALEEKLKSFEPSAALYLPENDRFLIASDDTDEKDTPYLFLMDASGHVEEKPLRFPGLRKMTDMESLAREGDSFYALSSLGKNKNGKEKAERNLFTRFRLEGSRIDAVESVELRSLLLAAAAESTDPLLRKVKNRIEDQLDVEASYVRDGRLFLGLKDPQPASGTAVLLELGPVDSLFGGREITGLRVARSWKFPSGHKLSDLVPYGESFLLATTTESGKGAVWLSDKNGALSRLAAYADAKPEGLALHEKRSEVLVVFDEGTDGNGTFEFLKLPR